MNCDYVRLWLAFARPAEMDPAELARLDAHLSTCPECGQIARAERGTDDAFAQAMQCVPVPEGLRNKLTARLAAARTSWWRHAALHACAACVAGLLAVSLTYAVTRPSLDLTTEAEKATWEPGLWKPNDRALEDANESLRSLGAPAAAPGDFKYQMLKFVGRMDGHGVSSAPTLFFTADQAYAKVVLVRDTQIKNLPALVDQAGEASGCWVTVRPVPGRSGWYYIITTYGQPLQFFILKTGMAA
jgi:Putative zinc-finger